MKIWHVCSLALGAWQNVRPQAATHVSDLGFPVIRSYPSTGAPISNNLTEALFLSCSLKVLEDPSRPPIKALLRDLREKNSGAFHEENQKNLAACFIRLEGTRPDSKTGLVGAGWGNEARNGEGINESLCLVY